MRREREDGRLSRVVCLRERLQFFDGMGEILEEEGREMMKGFFLCVLWRDEMCVCVWDECGGRRWVERMEIVESEQE
ncbi:hypothetical protein COLO4_04676 [Corchorus olitorius]|uniref:Uncharacterized protein n=1 Tax=Corchorus olitorius TaxID=93759 RepID=A0A1R3KT90_9ROSI|nr:hypothetical protein COLO4_04676 [Corchorus olitorius]